MHVFVRYYTPDENGRTRAEWYAEFERPVPALEIPHGGSHIWDWYREVTNGLRRVREGVCEPIPWTEWKAWQEETGAIVRPVERAILRRIDAAFCAETNIELTMYRERQAEEAKRSK